MANLQKIKEQLDIMASYNPTTFDDAQETLQIFKNFTVALDEIIADANSTIRNLGQERKFLIQYAVNIAKEKIKYAEKIKNSYFVNDLTKRLDRLQKINDRYISSYVLERTYQDLDPQNPIEIYNPRDFPFGPLSNNYQFDMVLHGKRWPTVTNYIFSNMLVVPLYKVAMQKAPIKGVHKNTKVEDKVTQIVANTEARQHRKLNQSEIDRIHQMVLQHVSFQKMDIHQLYNYYLGQEYIQTVRTAVEKSYNAKVSENPQLATLLLQSEDRPIVYVSGNALLGTGEDGHGQNFIGKVLMQIRHNLRLESATETTKATIEETEEQIFDAYRAMSILHKELTRDNDLSEYISKTPKEIITMYMEQNPEDTLESIGLGDSIKGSVLEMYRREQLPLIKKELENPGYIVLAARRDNLENLQKRLETRKAEIILSKYTEHIIRKKYKKMSSEDVAKAASQLIQTVPDGRMETYFNLRDKIVSAYMEGKFSDELNGEIEKGLADIPQISNKDIRRAKKMIVSHEENAPVPNESSSSSSGDDNPIKELLDDSENKAMKRSIIQILQKYTGYSASKYKKWSMEKLRAELDKYDSSNAVKPPKEGTGQWILSIKHPNNQTEIIEKTTGVRPGKQQVQKIVHRYNKGQPDDSKISASRVSIRWQSNIEPDKINTVQFRENLEDVAPSFVKYVGEPIEIRPIVEQNPAELQEFSPLFIKNFKVDGFNYPCVSIFITTMLMTQTGVSREIRDQTIYKRGTGISEARNLLMSSPGTFLSPDEANKVYDKLNFETHHELLQTYCKIAMKKKFEDVGLGQLLQLTQNRKLIWNDPNDFILGHGTSENVGQNLAGKILTQIRDEYKHKAVYDRSNPMPKDIALAVSSDPFLNSWMRMRLRDMCSVVYKMKQYLAATGKQDEEIDSRFVAIVLNIVYQPCSALIASSEKNEIPMPADFVRLIKECPGITTRLSKDYNSEIKAIQDERDLYDESFWGRSVRVENVEEKKKMSEKKYAKLLENFINQSPAPSRKEIKRFEKNLIAEYEGEEKKEVGFLEQQRLDRIIFLNDINKPALPWEEIHAQIAKLKRKQQKEIRKVSGYEDLEQAKEKQRKELAALWKSLSQPVLDQKKRSALREEFDAKQDEDRMAYHGYGGANAPPKSKEEIAKYKEILKDFKERIAILSKQKKEEEDHLQFNITDIALVYWNQIAAMIDTVARNINSANVTREQVREVIVNAELLNSNEASCSNIPDNLNNAWDNCIASALANILSGIEKFKHQYQENIPFGIGDIDLALGILLGRELEETKPVQEEVEPEEDVFVNEFEDDMQIEDPDEDGFGFAHFGMKRPSDQKEKIRAILAEIPKKYDVPIKDDIVQQFTEAITIVKTSKLAERVKRNRVNFFATLR